MFRCCLNASSTPSPPPLYCKGFTHGFRKMVLDTFLKAEGHNPQTFLFLEYMPQGLDLFPSTQVIGRNKRFTRIARIAKITRITKNARFTNVKRFIRNNILYSNLNWKIYHYFIILGLTAHQV